MFPGGGTQTFWLHCNIPPPCTNDNFPSCLAPVSLCSALLCSLLLVPQPCLKLLCGQTLQEHPGPLVTFVSISVAIAFAILCLEACDWPESEDDEYNLPTLRVAVSTWQTRCLPRQFGSSSPALSAVPSLWHSFFKGND
jgi:hypothetical protein